MLLKERMYFPSNFKLIVPELEGVKFISYNNPTTPLSLNPRIFMYLHVVLHKGIL